MRLTGKRVVAFAAAAVVLAIVAALTIRLCKPLQLAPDCALYLHCGELLLSGGIPYVDIWDTNPPLIMYVSTIPIVLASMLNMHPIIVFVWFIFALEIFSFLLICWLALHLASDDSEVLYMSSFLAGFGFINIMLSVTWLFGQREHIFVLCYFPFLLLRYCRIRNCSVPLGIALLIGLYCAFGMCIKPYFMLVALAAELAFGFQHLKKRLFSAEIVSAVVFIALYAAHFLFAPAAMKENFFGLILPLMKNGYGAYSCSLIKAATAMTEPVWLGVTLILAVLLFRRNPLIKALACFSLAAYITVLIQQKGFPYHPIPEVSGIVILGAMEIAALAELALPYIKSRMPIDAARLVIVASVIGGGGCLALTAINLVKIVAVKSVAQSIESNISNPTSLLLLSQTKDRDKVLFADFGWTLQYPLLLQINRQVGTRFMTCFPFALTEYLRIESDKSLSEHRLRSIDVQASQLLADDIARHQPKLVFFKTGECWPMKNNFDLSKLLLNFDSIKQSLQDYDPAGEHQGYVLFKRKTKSP